MSVRWRKRSALGILLSGFGRPDGYASLPLVAPPRRTRADRLLAASLLCSLRRVGVQVVEAVDGRVSGTDPSAGRHRDVDRARVPSYCQRFL
jgi:hypothetical protein